MIEQRNPLQVVLPGRTDTAPGTPWKLNALLHRVVMPGLFFFIRFGAAPYGVIRHIRDDYQQHQQGYGQQRDEQDGENCGDDKQSGNNESFECHMLIV